MQGTHQNDVMNSLKIKLLGLISLIIVLIIGISAWVISALQKEIITEIAERDVAVLTDSIKKSITRSMLTKQGDSINDLFQQLEGHDSIASLRILDKSGRILKSYDKNEIGSITHLRQKPIATGSSGILFENEAGVYTFHHTAIIENTKACHSCHPASHSAIGILEIDLSLKYLVPFLDRIKAVTLFSSILIIIFITFIITGFLIIYVDKPIHQLIRSMHNVHDGNFSPTLIQSSNEMSLLSESFNIMMERFKGLMNTTVHHERELAIAQEKLSHHHEIHLMNQKLEEQLKEIENLNISLEERIEEIEEANYKIADLAGELEDKNSNLEKAIARLSTLYTVGMAINCTMELDKLFHLLVKATMETVNAQIGYILLLDRGNDLLKVATLIGHDHSSVNAIPMKPSSVSSWVINNRKSLLIQNMDETPEFDRFSAIGYERKTLICVPLSTKDELIGTITVVNKNDNSVYTSEELELLTTISAQAGIAIENAQLYEQQQINYLSTIHALVKAIEASDSYTRGHSERVTLYSVALANKLELPAERIKVLERAAILHDIGKIGIDLTLLHKEETLTPEEMAVLQEHPHIGMRILEPIKFLHETSICIGQHHERFDGQGYPQRVCHEDLLLEARILAIADAYDAMTTDRPYRKAFDRQTAIEELLANAGTQFDPELVVQFVELVQSGVFSGDLSSEGSCPQGSTPSSYFHIGKTVGTAAR
jgi:HD-GYP domain-containing protein (c-di-GMP phosphodiesterase class II)